MDRLELKELKLKLRKSLDEFRNEIINDTTVTDMFERIPEYKLCEMFITQFDGGYIKLSDDVLNALSIADKPLSFIVDSVSKYLDYHYCIDDIVDSINEMNGRISISNLKYQYKLHVRKVFINIDYVNVIFRNTSFIDCKLDNCTFKDCSFVDCIFKSTDLPANLLDKDNNNFIKNCVTI